MSRAAAGAILALGLAVWGPVVSSTAREIVPEAARDETSPHGADLKRIRSRLLDLTRLGPRPSGSAANARAADYLGAALRNAGFSVRVVEGEGRSAATGIAGVARNVVGWLPATADTSSNRGDAISRERDALLLASHYDSVVDGPGGTDDASSVAALLVAAEDLARAPVRRRPVIVLFSDAEERYLLGADLFVREDPLASRVGAVINFDHSGRAAPLYHFESGPRSKALQETLWSLPSFPGAPRSFSFATDIYRVLPFDTDFTAFARLGVPGLNFGLVRDGYVYHTALDRGEDVPAEALLAIHRTAEGMARRLVIEGRPFAPAERDAADLTAFFPVGPLVIRFTSAQLLVLALLSLLLCLAALAGAARRGWKGLGRGLLAFLLSVPATFALALGTVAGLRAVKGVDQVAYAAPGPFFLLLGSVAVLASSFVARRVGAWKEPPAVRLGAVLIPWALCAPAGVAGIAASSASLLLPLAGLSLATLAALRARGRFAGAAAVVLALGSVLLVWAEPLGATLPFLVTTLPKMGPEPLAFWPGLVTFLALFLAPLPWALSGDGRVGRWVLGGAGALALLGVALVLALPAYDASHPQRVWAFHVTAPDTAYEVLASTDRLRDPRATLEPGREARELYWIERGWSRLVKPATDRSPLPVVSARREGGRRLIVEGALPRGVDTATLVLEGAEVDSSAPPATRHGRRRVLRRVVAGADSARFEITGRFPPGTRARLMYTTPGLPTGAPSSTARTRDGSRTTLRRTITVVEVPLTR